MAEILKVTIEDILKGEYENVQADYYSLAKDIYDKFDNNAFMKGYGYSTSVFPLMDERLEGLDEGLYIFAGESNSGKTATMTNIAWAYANNPDNKLFVVYYSLDDNVNEVIPRLIAMNELIPISVCSKPQRYLDFIANNTTSTDPAVNVLCEEYREYLDKREKGLQKLKDANEKLLIVDRNTVQDLDAIMDHAKKVQQYVKSFDPENNIIIVIDSLADVAVKGKFASEREKIDHIVTTIKHFGNNEAKIPVFASYHLRKLNHLGRPCMDDIKESGKIGYEASVVFMVYNDVSKNMQAASVFLTTPEENEKLPVVEIQWIKNKKSSFKGRIYYAFTPNYSKLVECPKEICNRFDSIIYTK